MAQIRERQRKDGSRSYLARIRIRGCPDATETFSRLTDARRWVQQTEVEMRSGRYLKSAESRKHTLSEAIRRYTKDVLSLNPTTYRDNHKKLEYWGERLGRLLLSDLSSARIVEERDLLTHGVTPRKTRRSNATVNRYLAALSAVCGTAVSEWEWLEENPMRRVSRLKEPRGRVRYLDDSELERLLGASRGSGNRALHLALVMALCTGARRMEVWGLGWSEVDLKAGHIKFLQTKNDDRRSVPLDGTTLGLLGDHARLRRIDSDRVFPSKKDPTKPMDFRRPFQQVLARAGIEDFSWHDLRHSCASYLAMKGVPLRTIAEILGHKTLQMVYRYSHLSPGHLKEAIDGLGQKIFG